MMCRLNHRNKTISKRRARKMDSSGGVINNSTKALKVTVLAVTAACAIIARTIPTADLA